MGEINTFLPNFIILFGIIYDVIIEYLILNKTEIKHLKDLISSILKEIICLNQARKVKHSTTAQRLLFCKKSHTKGWLEGIRWKKSPAQIYNTSITK